MAFDPSQPFTVDTTPAKQDVPAKGFDPSQPFTVQAAPSIEDRMVPKVQATPLAPAVNVPPESPSILGAMKQGYASAPPLINPESETGKQASSIGLGGLTKPIAPLAALSALQSGGEAAAVKTLSGMGFPQLGRDVAGWMESWGQTGAPHIPTLRFMGKTDVAPGEMSRPQAEKIVRDVQDTVTPQAAKAVRPEIKEASAAGYVFPPAEIPGIGEKPPMSSALAASDAGKIKLRQDASEKNQVTTNKLATSAIGLPEGTRLDDAAFNRAMQPAIAVYNEVRAAVPEVALDESVVQKAIDKVGSRGADLEKHFPELGATPQIEAVRSMLRRQGDSTPTAAVMQAIAALRKDASTNFKRPGVPEAHQLGLAQREAADVLENALGRAVENAPQYFQRRLNQANAARAEAQADFDYANTSKGYLPASNMAALIRDSLARLEQANANVRTWQARLADAQQKGSALATLPDRLKEARQLFAKVYTLENATNTTTGNVSASGLAKELNKGTPLSGQLASIAKAYNAAPQSMQVPELFGRSEDWSALDFYGTALTALHHPIAAAPIIARPWVRRWLLSPSHQQSLIGRQPGAIPPLPALDPVDTMINQMQGGGP